MSVQQILQVHRNEPLLENLMVFTTVLDTPSSCHNVTRNGTLLVEQVFRESRNVSELYRWIVWKNNGNRHQPKNTSLLRTGGASRSNSEPSQPDRPRLGPAAGSQVDDILWNQTQKRELRYFSQLGISSSQEPIPAFWKDLRQVFDQVGMEEKWHSVYVERSRSLTF
jgi:hypothetical protein